MDSKDRIIKDARVLEERFIPKEVKHREGKLHAMKENLRPALEGGSARDMYIYGPPGTGKTCLTKYILDELGKESSCVTTSYVNCFENSSKFRVLYEIVREIGSILSIHQKGTPTDEVLEKLRELVEDKNCVVVLDEVDKLKDEDVLYSLARTPEISLILIANKETALWNVDRRIRSSLASTEYIQFEQYGEEELVAILQDRVNWGLFPDSVRKEQLERIAMLAEGDARLAINGLRIVAEKSARDGETEIKDEFIEGSVSRAKELIDSKALELLSEDEMTLYQIIKKNEELKAGELHEKYEEKADDPVVKRTVRKYLDKLERLGLIETEGKGRWKKYKVLRE